MTRMTFAVIPKAAAFAARFGVAPEIHAEDYIFHYYGELLREQGANPDTIQDRSVESYFWDGANSAAHFDALIRQFHADYGQRRLSLLEFAAGYGRVTRHLARMADRYDLLACDIHPQAIAFLHDVLGVRSLASCHDPGDFAAPQRFDIVFALSFFSHMPDRTWGRWLVRLFDAVAEDGVLIFTTHGRLDYSLAGQPPLDPAGFWFGEYTEQRDLSFADYGTMLVTPGYVLRHLGRCARASLVFFQEGHWNKQDLYVVRKVPVAFAGDPHWQPPDPATAVRLARLDAEMAAAQRALETIRASRSWRLTAPLRRLGRWLKG
jgi:SAM-dependent methyltransferase